MVAFVLAALALALMIAFVCFAFSVLAFVLTALALALMVAFVCFAFSVLAFVLAALTLALMIALVCFSLFIGAATLFTSAACRKISTCSCVSFHIVSIEAQFADFFAQLIRIGLLSIVIDR